MAEQAEKTPPAEAEAPPAEAEKTPEELAAEARAIADASLAEGRAEEEAAAKKKAAADKRAAAKEFAARMKERVAEGKAAAAAAAASGGDRERAAKEASVPGSDPRDSVYDGAPGKSLDDILARNEELAAGYHTDVPAEPKPIEFYIVQDEADLLEVARSLNLPDHAELGALNGRYSSNYGVQRGQRIVLPAHYTFVGIDGVVTEDELAGSEPTA